MGDFEPWERIQMKTFTKWCNNHLKKRWGPDTQVEDILKDWETGLLLMHLGVALYEVNEQKPEQAISMPKLRANELNPKNRIQMVNNGAKAIDLLKKAGVNIRGVSAENLCDHNKVQILGMIWIIILDYAARGFGGTSAEVKRALLEWVNKKTDGYEKVNPPGVKNFTKDWRSGLAWCALIHKHRPDLLDYDSCLGKSNAENLELAFSVAEEHINIPRLLDVEDVDNDNADEKSIMTYVMEYFLAFAGDGLKDEAARQAADWLKFLREMRNRMNEYERRAKLLVDWMDSSKAGWSSYDFGSTKEEAGAAFTSLRDFVGKEKPVQAMEKMDLEALFAEIQSLLHVNNLAPYEPPAELTPDALESGFSALNQAESAHGKAVRENKFKFIEKKEEGTSEETLREIAESFRHYDSNGNGSLNKVEFNAACMEMGIAFKTEEQKNELFNQVGGGSDVSLENYTKWMESRMTVKMDNADSAKACFATLADNNTGGMSEAQLACLPEEEREFFKQNVGQNNGLYDFNAFVDKVMAGGSGGLVGGQTNASSGGGGGKFCTVCGSKNMGAKFCSDCGAKA
jgi:Ca2+-binding EF-hand superfamily protein